VSNGVCVGKGFSREEITFLHELGFLDERAEGGRKNEPILRGLAGGQLSARQLPYRPAGYSLGGEIARTLVRRWGVNRD